MAMDCVIPETLYLKANGVFPCHDDAGEVIPLGQLEDGFSLRGLLDGAGYDHVRRELQAGRAPWPGTCERCGFFRPHQPYRARTPHRVTTFQVEPTLLCTLGCPGCSRAQQIRTRPGPRSLTLDRFGQLLKTAVAERIEIECIEYCGQGEPLAHREFHSFVARARQVMPRTRQRLITNGNYDYGTVMQDQHLDEIIVSCDGATAGSYPIYRKNGDFARVQTFIADAARATPRPRVIWKYILFEFNDSTAELQRAQQLAMDHGVDALLFVVTHSAGRSQRHTPRNLEQLLKLTPFATINTTPVLESARTRFQARSHLRRTPFERLMDRTSFALARLTPRAPARAALHLDETRVIDSDAIHVRGWAHDGREPFERLTLTWNGREVARALLGIPRPDVRRVFPRVCSERVGFAATVTLPDALAAAFDLEVRARSRGSTRDAVFTVQVLRAGSP
jgi:MoaA/NifB/PqqE/SkfB family radical SAM enzyme